MNGFKGRVLSSFQISSWTGVAFTLGYPSSNPQSDRPPTSQSASQPHTHYTYSHLWFRVCVPVINPVCMNLFFIPPLFYSVSYDEVALFPLMCLTTTVWTVGQVTHPHNLTNQHYPSFFLLHLLLLLRSVVRLSYAALCILVVSDLSDNCSRKERQPSVNNSLVANFNLSLFVCVPRGGEA